MDKGEEARLKQFEVLWAEIARRSNAQQALIAATVTATGTLGGLVAAEDADPAFLLVLALIAPVFGLLWLDHARNIREIGRFIRRNWSWMPNWEEEHEEGKHGREGRRRYYVFVCAISIVFLVPALVGLGSICQLGDEWTLLLAWAAALLLTILFTASWGHHLHQTWPRHGGAGKNSKIGRQSAERVGFEPTRRVNPAHAISNRAP